jgi:hypothetical protein
MMMRSGIWFLWPAEAGGAQPKAYVEKSELLCSADDMFCNLFRVRQHHDMAAGNLDRRGFGGLDLIPL